MSTVPGRSSATSGTVDTVPMAPSLRPTPLKSLLEIAFEGAAIHGFLMLGLLQFVKVYDIVDPFTLAAGQTIDSLAGLTAAVHFAVTYSLGFGKLAWVQRRLVNFAAPSLVLWLSTGRTELPIELGLLSATAGAVADYAEEQKWLRDRA